MDSAEHGDRKEIRRPMNAFLIFCKRHRSMVREKNPHLDNRSVTRILGELWANLNDQEKTVYTDLAKQYKEAFMKANPDYKWHNPEKICSMAIKPIVKPPTLLRGPKNMLDSLSSDGIIPGKLADPSNMGGLNLLLMAGEQSLGSKAQAGEPEVSDNTDQTNTASREAPHKGDGSSQENTALLELAEMCSTQLVDTNKTSGVQGQKSERFSTSNVTVASSPCPLPAISSTASLVPSPVISSTSANASKSSAHCPACKTSSRSANQLLYSLIAEKPEVCLLPKENNNDEQKEARHAHVHEKADDVVSCGKVVVNHIIDQLFTRGDSPTKTPLNTAPQERDALERRMSHNQVEAVVKERLKAMSAPQSIEECMTKIIKEAYATQIQGDLRREKLASEPQAPNKSNSENSLMSQMLRTGTYNPPAKVSSDTNNSNLLKSPPSLHMSSVSAVGSRFVKPDPVTWGKSMEARMRLPKKRPYPGDIDCSDSYISDDGQTSPMVSPNHSAMQPVSSPICDDRSSGQSPRHENTQCSSAFDCTNSITYTNSQAWSEALSKDFDKSESNNARATRKSKRRNRGQRYLELINEGIIQPSKERLAAIRTESLSSVDDSPSDDDWKMEVGEDAAAVKSRGDNDKSDSEHSRYKSGDFDLEAHIATLPPCSMDSLSRKKRRHASGGSHSNTNNNNNIGTKSSPQSDGTDVEVSLIRPPHVKLQTIVADETVTGSRKRKARKHKITHLIAVQPNSDLPPSLAEKTENSSILRKEVSIVKTLSSLDGRPHVLIKEEPLGVLAEINKGSQNCNSKAFKPEVKSVFEKPRIESISINPKPTSINCPVSAPLSKTTTTSYKTNIVMKECKKFDIYEFSEDSEDLESTPSLSHLGYSDKPFGVSPRKVHHRLVPKQIE